MNQFKRAKQISNQTESITDLKTAGVVEPKEKSPRQDAEVTVKKEEHISDKLNTEKPQNITQPAISNNAQATVPEESPTDYKKSEHTVDVVATQPSKKEVMPDSIPAAKPEMIPQPVVYQEPSSVQTTNTQPQIILPQQVVQPVVQPQQYSATAITYTPEPVETKPAKSSKKSAPNMFTQKNESKSIRKSLVLRPSSVKIAENYCAKNGGSFNELIQILLDNFIEEYGL